MTVPTREQACNLLLALRPPDWLVAHSAAVAEVASFLARRITARGTPLDIALVEAAALLHDVDKALEPEDPRRLLGHGAGGAAWLAERGHTELAAPVANHPASRLDNDAFFSRWIESATVEEHVVAYADKRATQDVVSMRQRFDEWAARHPEHAEQIETSYERALVLEAAICAAAGISSDEVARDPWVEQQLAALR